MSDEITITKETHDVLHRAYCLYYRLCEKVAGAGRDDLIAQTIEEYDRDHMQKEKRNAA